MTPPRSTGSPLIIRIAMTAGIVAFAVLAFAVKRRGAFLVSMPAGRLSALQAATWIAAIVPAVALVILRMRLDQLAAARRGSVSIVAWALGGFAALFGLASYMLSGVERGAAPGLLTFAISMVLFPATFRD